jgi:hypothetical protein
MDLDDPDADKEITKQKFLLRLNDCKRLCLEYIQTFEDKKMWINLMKQSRIHGQVDRNSLRIPTGCSDKGQMSMSDLNKLETSEFS